MATGAHLPKCHASIRRADRTKALFRLILGLGNGNKHIGPLPARSELSLHDLDGGGRRFQRSDENVQGLGELGTVAGRAERDTHGVGTGLIDRKGIAADDRETIAQHMRHEIGAIPLARQ